MREYFPTMFDTIVKGIIIGLFISVPLGPIGILCVQRTLSKGRKHGIVTGLGATTSDLVYTVIALFFIGIVVDFIEEHQNIIQIVGSIIVILFGFFIYKSNPAHHNIKDANTSQPLTGDYVSSFLLTLSNPLILFILIALFARFEFLSKSTTLIHNIIGMTAILFGAFMWWSTLTFIVSRFNNKMTYRGVKLINHIMGVIIIGIGVVGIVLVFFNLLLF